MNMSPRAVSSSNFGRYKSTALLQVGDEFLLRRMRRPVDDELERLQIFFLQPLKFAHQHVPRMHEAQPMTVPFDFDGARQPIQRAAKSARIANLNIEILLPFAQPFSSTNFVR